MLDRLPNTPLIPVQRAIIDPEYWLPFLSLEGSNVFRILIMN